MDLNKFYHFDLLDYHMNFFKGSYDNLCRVLSNVCLNDNPIAHLVFSSLDGRIPSDLDINISPSSDPSVRSFVEQLRSELPLIHSFGLPDDELFNHIIPNNAQFGDELNDYIDNLRSYVLENINSKDTLSDNPQTD